MSIAKPIIIMLIHKTLVALLKIQTNIYHFDINTKENGIPETKNNNTTNKYLYTLFDINDSVVFFISTICKFCCIWYRIDNKQILIKVWEVIEKLIPFIIDLSFRYDMQKANKDVCAKESDIIKFKILIEDNAK